MRMFLLVKVICYSQSRSLRKVSPAFLLLPAPRTARSLTDALHRGPLSWRRTWANIGPLLGELICFRALQFHQGWCSTNRSKDRLDRIVTSLHRVKWCRGVRSWCELNEENFKGTNLSNSALFSELLTVKNVRGTFSIRNSLRLWSEWMFIQRRTKEVVTDSVL